MLEALDADDAFEGSIVVGKGAVEISGPDLDVFDVEYLRIKIATEDLITELLKPYCQSAMTCGNIKQTPAWCVAKDVLDSLVCTLAGHDSG